MTTIEDTIASHLDTNWDEDSGNNPKPTIDIRLDIFAPENLSADNILVDSRTLLSRTRSGAGILREEWRVTLQVAAKTTSGSTSTLKDRLDQLVTEVLHVMDKTNHAISGYCDHYGREVPFLSEPGSDELAYATVEVYLVKQAVTA